MKTVLFIIGLLGVIFFAHKMFPNVAHFEKNGNIKKHIKSVSRFASYDNKAESLEHYDEEGYEENMEDFEAEMYESEFMENVEHFKKRLPESQARKAAYNKLAGKHGPKFTKAMTKQSAKKAGVGGVGKNPFYDAAAQFDLTITRNTANINIALTVPLFASVHYNAKYLSIMGNYLPNGISISTIAVDSLGNVVFTLLQAGTLLTDTITVACTQIPYITFLAALNYNAMRLGKIRYAISDVTKLQQFSQPFEVYGKTIFGKHGGNGVSLASQNDPKNLNTGVRDIDNSVDIDNSTAVIVGILPVVGFAVTLSSFVQMYNRSGKLG